MVGRPSLTWRSWITYDWVDPKGRTMVEVDQFTGNASFINIYVRI